jgi:hypothetical protein
MASLTLPIRDFNMDREPASNGEQTTSTIKITGVDYTTIEIPIGTTVTKDESTNNKYKFTTTSSDDLEFVIIFPANTIHKTLTSGSYKDSYTTPYNYTYRLENSPSSSTFTNMTRVIVTSGVIDISNNLTEVKTTNSEPDGKKTIEMIEKTSYNIFHNTQATFIYTQLKDIFIVFLVWFALMTIGIWGTIESNYIYPYDVTKYPYVFIDENCKFDRDLNNFVSNENEYCVKTNNSTKINNSIESLGKLSSDIREKLNIINPSMADPSKENVYRTAQILHNTCSSAGSTTSFISVVIYWVCYMAFQQTLFQEFLLNRIHLILNQFINGAKNVDKIMDQKWTRMYYVITSIKTLFIAGIIYGIIIFLGNITDSLKELFKAKLGDINYIETFEDLLSYLCLTFISLVLFIVIPSYFLFFFVGILVHFFYNLKIVYETKSMLCLMLSVLSMVALCVMFADFINFLIVRTSDLISLNSILEQLLLYFKNLLQFKNVFISIGAIIASIPLVFAVIGSLNLAFRIFASISYFLTKNADILYNFVFVPIVLLLIFLCMNVSKIYGPIILYITLGVIGFFILTMFFGKKLVEKGIFTTDKNKPVTIIKEEATINPLHNQPIINEYK